MQKLECDTSTGAYKARHYFTIVDWGELSLMARAGSRV